jgi:hypothetical protein
MTDDEQAQLVLSPVRFGNEHDDLIITADCGHRAYISSGGIQTQARMNARTVCMDCVNPDEIPEINITPEVYADLVSRIGQEEADHLIELANDPANRALMFGPESLPAKVHRMFGTS